MSKQRPHVSSSSAINNKSQSLAPLTHSNLEAFSGYRAPSSSRASSISSDVTESTQAVFGCAALVGESVMENLSSSKSPTAKQKRLMKNSNARMQELMQQQQQDSSSPSRTTRAKEYISSSYSTGVQWWKERRERKQREALEKQVEEQKRILMEAQQQKQSHRLQDNSTFQSIMRTSSSDHTKPKNKLHVHESHSGEGLSVDMQLPESPRIENTVTEQQAEQQAEEDEDWIPPVRVEEEPPTPHPFCPFILSPDQMQQLAVKCLPPGISYARWTRLYSLARDGDAFDHFMQLVKGHSHTLLVIRTTRNHVFGGYADSAWETQPNGGAVFYGSAQACLFSYAVQENNSLSVFKWTGINRYIQLCDVSNKMIAFGGGGREGAFGLCVQQDFQRGSTGSCDTFRNAPLCPDESFDVVDLEVYGFLIGQF